MNATHWFCNHTTCRSIYFSRPSTLSWAAMCPSPGIPPATSPSGVRCEFTTSTSCRELHICVVVFCLEASLSPVLLATSPFGTYIVEPTVNAHRRRLERKRLGRGLRLSYVPFLNGLQQKSVIFRLESVRVMPSVPRIP